MGRCLLCAAPHPLEMVATAKYGAPIFSSRLVTCTAPRTVCVRLNDINGPAPSLLADHAILILIAPRSTRPSAVLIYFHCFRHSNRTVWFLIY